MSKYICPHCQGTLIPKASHLFCSHCCHVYPQDEHGITHFGRQHFWRYALAPTQIAQIVAAAARQNWQTALRDYLAPHTTPTLYQQALSESQADWHFLLDLPPQARVLVLGCGWGQITTALARHYDEVHTLDANLLALQFVYWRTRQEGVKPVTLAQNDPIEWSDLPYPDHSFHLVVLNDSLAWIGAARTEAAPDVYQAAALHEIRRVLHPGGTLYLHVENRLAYNNFWGHKTENDAPFAPLLPRPWANWLSRYLGQAEGYRHYTYSLAGYRHLLAQHGLNLKQVYAVYPQNRPAEAMYSVALPQEPDTMRHPTPSNGIGRQMQWLLQSHIWPWFAPGYGLIVQRGEKSHGRVNVRTRSATGTVRGRAAAGHETNSRTS